MAPGQHVLLETAGGERLAARVEHAGDERTTLALFVVPDQLPLGDASVEFTSRRGVLRVGGRLEERPAEDHVVLVHDGPPRLVQRRDFVRVDAQLRVALDAGGRVEEAWTNDLSGGGLLLSGAHLEAGESAFVRVELPDGKAVEAFVTCVREHEDGRCAVRIEAIAPQDQDALVRLAFEKERLARKMVRDG